MKVLGLTGSVGMGKSGVARMLGRFGFPVFDADAEVHRILLEDHRAVAAVAAAFPGSVLSGRVDRRRLGDEVFADAAALGRLESILHPLVRIAEKRFLDEPRKNGAPVAVLEVPLLFETGSDSLCDAVAVATASREVQEARVLSRPGMSPERLRAVLARQMDNADKVRLADYVFDTGVEKRKMLRQVRDMIKMLCQ